MIYILIIASCSEDKNNSSSSSFNIIKSEFVDGNSLLLTDSLILYNTKENFIGAVGNIYYWRDYFLISDYVRKCLHVLDTNMTYVKKLGKEGKGPGEFTSSPILVKESDSTLKIVKPLEKKICVYNEELHLIGEYNLPNKFNYQFRLPLETDSLIIFPIGYPGSLADVSYYENHKSLALINKYNWEHDKDIFNFDPIYHDERYSGYTGSYFGVILCSMNNGRILAIQRASNMLTIFDNKYKQKLKFGIESKFYKKPQMKTLKEVQQSYDAFTDFGTKNTLITNLHYDFIKEWSIISFINKSKEAYTSRDKSQGTKFLQIYNSEYNCIIDESINGVFLFSINGEIYILREESPERLVIEKYTVV